MQEEMTPSHDAIPAVLRDRPTVRFTCQYLHTKYSAAMTADVVHAASPYALPCSYYTSHLRSIVKFASDLGIAPRRCLHEKAAQPTRAAIMATVV